MKNIERLALKHRLDDDPLRKLILSVLEQIEQIADEMRDTQNQLDTCNRMAELEAHYVATLEALKTIQVVNAGDGPLRREIIEATCDSAIHNTKETNDG